ncbi:hypothetical protein [Micromonospora sp. DPT]|uniref:hypothetical protein n=1 Tax=Micromonospora sp. DPT TaxID=3142975 RepID=UPI003207A259
MMPTSGNVEADVTAVRFIDPTVISVLIDTRNQAIASSGSFVPHLEGPRRMDSLLFHGVLGLLAVAAIFLAIMLGVALLTKTPLSSPRRAADEERDQSEHR